MNKFLAAGCGLLALGSTATLAQTAFPLMPSMSAFPDGTLQFDQRTIPLPTLMSPEAKAKYIELINRSLQIKPASREEMSRMFMSGAGAGIATAREAARKVYPVGLQETQINGVKVEIYTPADIPKRNRNRVVMMFNSDPVGVIIAGIGKMKVIAVHYTPTTPMGNQQIIAVYRTLLQTHKPSQIAMVGLSGGCQFGGNTAFWLPSQKLPFPGALGLLTCAGGRSPGDSRNTLNGLDVQLAGYTMMGAIRTSSSSVNPPAPSPAKPGEPQNEVLNNTVPAGFPASYVLTGTRDMSLSQSVLLHRKLRNAGIKTDLNVFEGMWHGFNMEPGLPETREATADLVAFLDRNLAL